MDRQPDPADAIDWPLLERYLAGECTPAEAVGFEAWIAKVPARKAFVESVRSRIDAWRRTRSVASDTEMALSELLDRIAAPAHAKIVRDRPEVSAGEASALRAPRPAWRIPVLAAATVIVAIAISATWLQTRRPLSQQVRDFASAAGSRATVTLRDGTQLVLGPATHLRVPADFGRTERVVELDGEAVFTVVHDAAHPFAVRTANAVIRDVGTIFVVRAYADDRDERVAVTEGRVSVAPVIGAVRERPLRAGDMAVVADTAVVITHEADVAGMTAWMQGRLVFDKTPLPRALADVARTYDLVITIADSSLVVRSVTAAFGNESADDVLDALTRIVGARYERVGRSVVIRRRAGAAADPAAPNPSAPVRLVGASDRSE